MRTPGGCAAVRIRMAGLPRAGRQGLTNKGIRRERRRPPGRMGQGKANVSAGGRELEDRRRR